MSVLTRRDLIRSTLATAALGALPGRAGRHRVAIVGAGMGGIAAAYFLAGTHDVEVFEARAKIGGHCDSHVIDYRGRRLTVDLGAQFFHPDTHPLYVTLLDELGLYDPAHPTGGETLEAPASLCIFPAAGGPPTFSSTNPFATPQHAIDFASYAELARQAVLTNLPWETTVEGWIRGLPISQSFKDAIAYPWITALIGSPRSDALRASARSILQTVALSFPADIVQGASTYNSRIGLQGNLQRLLDRSPGVRVRLGAATDALTRDRTGWYIHTNRARHGPYRFVILNAPPHAGRHLTRPLRGFAGLTALLDVFEYFDSRLLIHSDPTYMHHNRSDWAVYNAGVHGRACEGSVWYGALHRKLPSGATIDVFKSWAERRRADPRRILLERRFKHPVIARSTIDAARALSPWQGRHGLYLSGQYTTGFDSQESALYSAMKVAESLAPHSRRLASLKTLLTARGRAGISYDL